MQVNLLQGEQFLKMETIQAEVLKAAIQHCEGNISKAAKVLGIGRSTIYRLNNIHHIF